MFQKESFRKNVKITITINVKIIDEIIKKKLQTHEHYHQLKFINIYEYLTGEVIMPFDKSKIIEQVTFSSSPLEKTSGKKTIKDKD